MSKWINETDLLVNIVKKSRYTSKTIGEAIDESQSIEVVRCKDCKYKYLDDMIWNCPFGLSGGENFFCGYGAKDGDSDEDR